MAMQMTLVEEAYWRAVDAMTGAERVARAEALLHMGREMLARRVRSELGESVSEERIKWEVALRMYESDSRAAKLIREKLKDVPA